MPRRRFQFRGILLLVVIALMAYPVSFGPAFWICTDARGLLQPTSKRDFFMVVYAPLIEAYQKGPKPVRAVLGWYLELWGMP